MTIEKKKLVHITHNDGDAVGCDLVLHYVFYGWDRITHWMSPNETDKLVIDLIDKWDSIGTYPEEIVISDISVSLPVWNKLEELHDKFGVKIHMFDHHPTNPCRGLSLYVDVYSKLNDAPVSAAMIMFMNQTYNQIISDSQFVNLRNVLYPIIRAISRYDTWEWRNNPESHDIPESLISDICKFIGPENTINNLVTHLSSILSTTKDLDDNAQLYPQLFNELNNVITMKKKASIDKIPEFIKLTDEGEYRFATFVADNEFTNEIAEEIYRTYDIDIVRILYPSSCKVGFRTGRDDVNVGRLANRLYGGGGHVKAAGARLTLDQFITIYENIMNAPPLQEITRKVGI